MMNQGTELPTLRVWLRLLGAGLLAAGLLAAQTWPQVASAGLSAPTAASALAKAKLLYADLDFEGAFAAYTQVTKAETNNASADQRAAALLGRGLCASVLRRGKEARAAFLEAFAIDPSLRLPPDTSPKLKRPFLAARKLFMHDYAPRLSLDKAALLQGLLVIQAKDPLGLVTSLRLSFQSSDAKQGLQTLEARARDDGSFLARAPAAGPFRLFGLATNSHGKEVARLGSAAHPLRGRMPRAPQTLDVATPPRPSDTPIVGKQKTATLAQVKPANAEPVAENPEHAVLAGDSTQPTPAPHTEALPAAPDDSVRSARADSSKAVEGVAVAKPFAPAALPATSSSRHTGPSPWAYGLSAGALAFAAGGGLLGLGARHNASSFNGDPASFGSQSEALQVGRSARSQALGANLLFVGAAACAGAAAYLFARPRGSSLSKDMDEDDLRVDSNQGQDSDLGIASVGLAVDGHGALLMTRWRLP